MDDNHNDDSTEIEKAIGKTKRRTKARIIRSVWFNEEAESEKHYRELMLFTPWQNGETDLIGMCSSYQDCYMLLSNAINEQMKQYAVSNKDFNEIQ